MSVEVDDVWLYELILSYLKKIEEQSPILVRESPHFTNGDRKIIIEWITKLIRLFKIGIEAHHLAVFLFDYFIADHQADAKGLYLIGAACFSVACKVNDVEINVPQASKILRLAPFDNVMQSYLLKSTEILVLQHFNWNVHKTTEASFLEYYGTSCLAVELEYVEDMEYAHNLAKYYDKWITYFREKVLLNDEFRDHRPSKVASSIVISTRISMNLVPDWPDFMVHLTGWYKSDLIFIVNNLRSDLRSDLLMEKYSDLNQSFIKQPDLFHILNHGQRFSNSIEQNIIDSSLIGSMEDSFSQFRPSNIINSGNSSNGTIVTEAFEIPSNYFLSPCFNDGLDYSQNNPYQMLNSSYFSVDVTHSQSSFLNSIVPDNEMKLSNNHFYLPKVSSSEHSKSLEGLTTADLSFKMSNHHYLSNLSSVFPTSLVENFKPSIRYQNPIPSSVTSSSIYVLLSQKEKKRQMYNKSSHFLAADPMAIASRRSQNSDFTFANCENNGYHPLKKKSPRLVINVNGGGSSYSLNL